MMTRKHLGFLAGLLILSLAAGCGATEKEALSSGMTVTETTAAAAETLPHATYEAEEESFYREDGLVSDTTLGSSTTPSSQSEQKLIKKVYIEAETEDMTPLLDSVAGQVNAIGGYIEYQQIYNDSLYSGYRYRSADMTIRIPADRLDHFVEEVNGLSNVVSYNQSQENVTLTYVATESRVKALETEQQRLLELLEKAENMTDLLEIEARLTEVRYELENVASQLRVLSNQVEYATVELHIQQVKVYTEVEEQTLWQRIVSGFRDNLAGTGENLADLLVWIVSYSPQLIAAVGIIIALILLYRRRRKPTEKDTQKAGKKENS